MFVVCALCRGTAPHSTVVVWVVFLAQAQDDGLGACLGRSRRWIKWIEVKTTQSQVIVRQRMMHR